MRATYAVECLTTAVDELTEARGYDDNLVEMLDRIAIAEREIAQARRHAVAALRIERGWSFTRIGDALGISKQAAAKTYGEFCDRALTADVKKLRKEIAGQVSVAEAIAEAEADKVKCPGCGSTYDRRAQWVKDGDAVCLLCQKKTATREVDDERDSRRVEDGSCGTCFAAASESHYSDCDELAAMHTDALTELAKPRLGTCQWRPEAKQAKCDAMAVDERHQLCGWHMAQLDDADVELAIEGAGAVPCPECGVDVGESCRVFPTYQPTRGKRPHAKRLKAAAS